MGRPRIHASDADRVRAHRAAHSPPRQGYVMSQARTLRHYVHGAARAGDALAQQIDSAREDELLTKLIAHFRALSPD